MKLVNSERLLRDNLHARKSERFLLAKPSASIPVSEKNPRRNRSGGTNPAAARTTFNLPESSASTSLPTSSTETEIPPPKGARLSLSPSTPFGRRPVTSELSQPSLDLSSHSDAPRICSRLETQPINAPHALSLRSPPALEPEIIPLSPSTTHNLTVFGASLRKFATCHDAVEDSSLERFIKVIPLSPGYSSTSGQEHCNINSITATQALEHKEALLECVLKSYNLNLSGTPVKNGPLPVDTGRKFLAMQTNRALKIDTKQPINRARPSPHPDVDLGDRELWDILTPNEDLTVMFGSEPGDSGFVLTIEAHADLFPSQAAVLGQRRTQSAGRVYQGDYNAQRVGYLTAQQFKDLPLYRKRALASEVLHSRVKIPGSRATPLLHSTPGDLSEDRVISAFACGQLKVIVLALQCYHFDFEFLKSIIALVKANPLRSRYR
ncbi:hypothetical protein JAAARDRAFT_195640 [Jaapia argillacea MUCL 33604]|uniref:DUF6697 domain-containing protein n=1 Tax=Jaapia argillacea MUCL 33604 TaxID=933084 RepID=A0A067PPU1_9AGAM|nr:hypothetical protein JAAARDRAFT_195640 [Jaapia argillacea MUCL 33604]